MLTPELKIRCFKPDDFVELQEIDRVCFPPHISFSGSELLYNLNHPRSITRVAEASGRILGFALARIEGSRRAHVITLDVIPEARRQKIGTMLMNELHDELGRLGIRVIVLEVSAGNLPARKLYEKLQYSCLETLPGYYHGLEDAYRMVRLS